MGTAEPRGQPLPRLQGRASEEGKNQNQTHPLRFYFRYKLENKLKSESLAIGQQSALGGVTSKNTRLPRAPLLRLLHPKDTSRPAGRLSELAPCF